MATVIRLFVLLSAILATAASGTKKVNYPGVAAQVCGDFDIEALRRLAGAAMVRQGYESPSLSTVTMTRLRSRYYLGVKGVVFADPQAFEFALRGDTVSLEIVCEKSGTHCPVERMARDSYHILGHILDSRRGRCGGQR